MSGGRERPRQIALDLGHGTGRSRDDLIVTPSNREAVDAIDRWPAWASPFLVLAGGRGSGKTHLLNAWAERAGAAVVGRGELGAIDLGGAPGPVAIDDADGPGLDEAGLFHLLNAARAGGSHVLMTASKLPAAWDLRLPDLASRLRTAAAVRLGEPDDALLAGVIAKLFADRQVEVDPGVVQFLVRHADRSLEAAASAIEALDRAAMENKSRITRQLAAGILARDAAADREAPDG